MLYERQPVGIQQWERRCPGGPRDSRIVEPGVTRGVVSAGPRQGRRHCFADSVCQDQIRCQSGRPISCTSEEGLLIILAKSQPVNTQWGIA